MTSRVAPFAAAVFALATIGCRSEAPRSVPAPTATPAQQVDARAGADADAEDSRTLLEDLDGDGKPEQIVVSGGIVKVANAKGAYPAADMSALEVEVIDIDKKDKSRELAIIDPGIQDDATYHVFVYKNEALTQSPEIFTDDKAAITGNGILETHAESCGVSTTVQFVLSNNALVKKSEKIEGKYDDALCAACPFVYVSGRKGPRLAGEILRYQSGPERLAAQKLVLDAADVIDGSVRVRLAERKPETTYLDSIHLLVGNVRVLPNDCTRPHAWCATDGAYDVIQYGAWRDFQFEIPAALAGAPVELWANGYYVPLAAP